MVLTNRYALLIAFIAGVSGHQMQAQRGSGDPPVGRGRSMSGPLVGRGRGARPLLFGFALECVDCARTGRGGRPFGIWHYSEYPHIAAVAAGSAAERAGIRRGDVLVAIEGLSVLTDEGAQRLGEARPGDGIRLTLERAGKTIDAVVTLGSMLDLPVSRVPDQSPPRSYSSSIGSAAVDVWSTEPVIESTDSTGALVLRIGNTTVRVDSRTATLGRGRGRANARPPSSPP